MISKKQALQKIVFYMPIFASLIVTSFMIASVSLLILDNYKIEYILPSGAILSVLLVWLASKLITAESQPTRGAVIWTLIALAYVLGWVVWNGALSSEHVFVNRDPGIYTNSAIWLTNHDDLHPKVIDDYRSVNGISDTANGLSYSEKSGKLDVQGLHALPALLGVGGRLFGINTMLHLNVVIAGFALLSMFAAARHFLSSKWAFMSMMILSLTMPFIYFSRDTYGEPLMAMAIFGAIALAGYALKYDKHYLWALSGLLMGASSMVRVDAYITSAAFIFFLVTMGLLAGRRELPTRLKDLGIFLLPFIAVSLVGLVDLKYHSSAYFISQTAMMKKEGYLMAGILVLGLGMIFVKNKFKTSLKIDIPLKTRLKQASFWGVLIIGGLLMSRPLWYKGYLFAREGVREAHTVQSYSEYATYWVSWYIGDLIFLAGLVGLAVFSYLTFQRAKSAKTLLAFILGANALLYFLMPSIYPDQVWASRRMLPVIIPGIIIVGMWLIATIISRFSTVLPQQRVSSVLTYIVAGGFLVVVPFTTSRPLLINRDVKQLDTVTQLCSDLPRNSEVVFLDDLGKQLTLTIRGLCDVEAVNLQQSSLAETKQQLEKIKKLLHGNEQLVAITHKLLVEDDLDLTLIATQAYVYSELDSTMLGPPRVSHQVNGNIYVYGLAR